MFRPLFCHVNEIGSASAGEASPAGPASEDRPVGEGEYRQKPTEVEIMTFFCADIQPQITCLQHISVLLSTSKLILSEPEICYLGDLATSVIWWAKDIINPELKNLHRVEIKRANRSGQFDIPQLLCIVNITFLTKCSQP